MAGAGGAGHDVVFATPSGQQGRADDLMVTGQGLDPWGFVPGLRRPDRRRPRPAGRRRRPYRLHGIAGGRGLRGAAALGSDRRRSAYDALVLPGGHRARGMRPYLESPEVQQMAIDAFRAEKPVGAAHGVPRGDAGRRSGHGALGVRPQDHRGSWALEDKAWGIARFTRFWDRDYYRTYTEEPGQRWGYLSVQQEVTRALADPADFADVEKGSPDWQRKASGHARDTLTDERPAFVVRDGSYVSARWPGDAHTFARTPRRCWRRGPKTFNRRRARC